MIDQMELIRRRVAEIFEGCYVPAHDFKHILRVAGTARTIAEREGYDPDEAEVAGLLHDLGRATQSSEDDHAEAGLHLAFQLLNELTSFERDTKSRIISAIKQHSQKESEGALAHILQDADKIDGLGAIGLMRAYTSKSHLVDYPDGVIVEQGSRRAQTISEQVAFQLEWYDMLYTESARRLAKPRFDYMCQFMRQLKQEVDESLEKLPVDDLKPLRGQRLLA